MGGSRERLVNQFKPWGWLYYGFNGKLLPRVLCSCSGVHPKRGLEPVPVRPYSEIEECPMCMNVGIHPVPYTEMLNEDIYNKLDEYLR